MPGLPPPPPPPPLFPPPLPQPSTPPSNAMRATSIASNVLHLRRLAGKTNGRMQARLAPPAAYQGTPRCFGKAKAPLVGAVVLIVRVACPTVAPLILTGIVAPKLKVGRFTAPDGREVSVAVSATLPVNPPPGVTVIVEVLPVVAAGNIDRGAAEMMNPLTVSESGTERDASPLLVLIVRPYVPTGVEDVVVRSKATAANPPGRRVTLDSAKSHDAPKGRPEHANWLNSSEYPAMLCGVRIR